MPVPMPWARGNSARAIEGEWEGDRERKEREKERERERERERKREQVGTHGTKIHEDVISILTRAGFKVSWPLLIPVQARTCPSMAPSIAGFKVSGSPY